jgi:hypothetical protein
MLFVLLVLQTANASLVRMHLECHQVDLEARLLQ